MNELNQKSREISSLNFKIKQIEIEEELPKIKKDIEDTYYKTEVRNTDAQAWYLYIHIDKVVSIYEATGFRFEQKYDGIHIDPRPLALYFEDGKLNVKWEKITKEEFNKAFVEMLNKIKSLNK